MASLTQGNSKSLTKQSWLCAVKGASPEDEARSVRPAKRGARLARCRGEFLVMLGHYGWIMSSQHIDHPAAGKHAGRIYINKKDIRHRSEPRPGDEVVFYLYVDESGLGAEDCYVVGEAQEIPSQKTSFTWVNSQGNNEPPMNPHALEFTPSFQFASRKADENPHAAQFTPSCQYANAEVDEFLSAYESTFAFDDTDSEVDDQCCPFNLKYLEEDELSTDAGDDSDNDWEAAQGFMTVQTWSAPPGLAAPPGMDLPPGLEPVYLPLAIEPPPGLDFDFETLNQNRLLMMR